MSVVQQQEIVRALSVGDDPVVEAYKRDVDRTILRENLKLSVDERFRRFESFMRGIYELRAAGRQLGDGSRDAGRHD